MAVRTTVEIPDELHEILRERSHRSGESMRSLIVQAIEQTYQAPKKGKMVTGPLVKAEGKLGPRFPVDETPHDLICP